MPILDKTNKIQVAKYIEFLKGKDNTAITQDFDFLSSDQNNNFEIVYLEKNDNIIATMALSIMPVNKKYNILYCCRGPVCDIYNLSDVVELVNESKLLVDKYNAIMLIMDPEVERNERLEKLYKTKGFKVCQKLPFDFLKEDTDSRMILGLETMNSKNIMGNLQDKARYYIETAEKRNIYIKASTTKRELDKFIKLYEKENVLRFQDVRNFQTFKNLLKTFDNDVIRTYIASVDGRTLCAAVVCNYKGKIACLKEVCLSDSLGTAARAKMHYEIIKWGVNSGCTQYDMGQPDAKNNRFKELFTTKDGQIKYIGKICKIYNNLPLFFLRIRGGKL